MTDAAAVRPRRGRRPGGTNSRAAILEAARACFARDGYTQTTLRAVARDAHVDPALVLQFFGSKEQLFGAVMSITPQALTRIADAFSGSSEGIGARVVRAYLDVWEDQTQDAAALMATLRSVVTSESASAGLGEFIEARLVLEVRPDLRNDVHARARLGLASSMLVGVIIGRRIIGVASLVNLERDVVVALLAPSIEAILDSGRQGSTRAPKQRAAQS